MAILQQEPGWNRVQASLEQADTLRMTAPGLVELRIVAVNRNPAFLERIARLVDSLAIEVVAFDRELAELALAGYRQYGKGFHSRAQLNLGDCFSYTLAKATGEPLLFVGDDFSHTDILPALTS